MHRHIDAIAGWFLLQVTAMIRRANELVAGFDPGLEQKRFSVFTTKEEQTHAKVGLPQSLPTAIPRSAFASPWVAWMLRCVLGETLV
jgi:hypothetical protein